MGNGNNTAPPVKEPQSHITAFAFQRDDEVDERTRVNSYEELVFLNRLEVLHRTLKVPIYATIARSWMHLKISKDGMAREEAVESLRATNEVKKGHYTGSPMVLELEDQKRSA